MRNTFNNKGLTLIEIIVTIAVLGVVVSPLMSMFITSQKINNEGDKEFKKLQVAQRFLEDVKSLYVLSDIEKLEYNDYNGTKKYISNGEGYKLEYSSYEDLNKEYDVKVDILKEGIEHKISVSYDSIMDINIAEGSIETIRESSNKIIIDSSNLELELDLSIEDNKLIINGIPYLTDTDNIRININSYDITNTSVTINVVDNKNNNSIIYIDSNGCSYSIKGNSKIPLIIPVHQKVLLYNIVVYVDGKEILRNSKAFK